jgi:hypothetical protein
MRPELRPDLNRDGGGYAFIFKANDRFGDDEADVFLETIFETAAPMFFGRLVSRRVGLNVHFPISNLDWVGLNIVGERIERIPTR